MRLHGFGLALAGFGSITAIAAGCGGGSSSNNPDAMTSCGTPNSGAGVLQDFQPPCDPGAKGIMFTASGEVLALGGYDFPPATPDDVAFVDGWEIRYDRVLTTFDHIKLSSNPDKSPTDESQTDAVVAEADGPWAVDLHKGGPLMGKGGGNEQAVPVAALTGRTVGGGSFDSTMRYAFGFEIVPATTTAKNVNLDAADLTDYQDMVSKGYTTMLVGTATWKGGTMCTSTDPTYDFTQLPPVVKFRLGFKTPTTYENCQNPELTGTAFPNEEHQRGIQVVDNQSTIAQCTFHLDHAFWESFVHDSPAHFDQFASQFVGATSVPTATMDAYTGKSFTPFKDNLGKDVPWRSCLSTYTPPGMGAMSFDTQGVPVDPAGNPATSIRDFVDYTDYNHSTFGHLNSDGLCYVARNYPSPH